MFIYFLVYFCNCGYLPYVTTTFAEVDCVSIVTWWWWYHFVVSFILNMVNHLLLVQVINLSFLN